MTLNCHAVGISACSSISPAAAFALPCRPLVIETPTFLSKGHACSGNRSTPSRRFPPFSSRVFTSTFAPCSTEALRGLFSPRGAVSRNNAGRTDVPFCDDKRRRCLLRSKRLSRKYRLSLTLQRTRNPISSTKLRMQHDSSEPTEQNEPSAAKTPIEHNDREVDEEVDNLEHEIEEFEQDLDDEFYGEDENSLDYLSEKEWLNILEQEDLEEDYDDFGNIEPDLDELLELEETLAGIKFGERGKVDEDEDDFWMTGGNYVEAVGGNGDLESETSNGRKWSGQTFPSTAWANLTAASEAKQSVDPLNQFSGQTPLERALLQGVVPADAGVGSKSLPGDYGFDPLGLAKRDAFRTIQSFMLRILPPPLVNYEELEEEDGTSPAKPDSSKTTAENISASRPRPPALILRDYREAEIRHGRLAMLAAIIWPLQEIIDRFLLPVEDYTFTVPYGGVTLPFLSLFMTLIMMLLGYLDIYAKTVKDADTGEAFLPGECFWDPLCMLEGAPDDMKRRMQERELSNGRIAMIAVALYALQEAFTHTPLVELPWNKILFEPAYQIPAVQQWLDERFQTPSPTFYYPGLGQVDFVEIVKEALEDEGGEIESVPIPDEISSVSY